MVQINIWGPPIWRFFHVLIEKIKEENFSTVHRELFNYIKRICSYLPCPECSQHANQFLSKITPNQISNKNDFKNMLYVFHNQVNKRKQKQPFPYSEMERYKQYNIIHVYNKFISVYNTKGNMKMLTETFQRQFIIRDLKNWLIKNINCFNP